MSDIEITYNRNNTQSVLTKIVIDVREEINNAQVRNTFVSNCPIPTYNNHFGKKPQGFNPFIA